MRPLFANLVSLSRCQSQAPTLIKYDARVSNAFPIFLELYLEPNIGAITVLRVVNPFSC